MHFRWKKMPFAFPILALIIALAACGNSPMSPSRSPAKLVVYVSGLGESLSIDDVSQNNGYGYAPSFYAAGDVQPYLQRRNEFQGAQSLVFSYSGFAAGGRPDAFSCADTFNNQLTHITDLLNRQIAQYLKGHPNTDVYIVSHSLGGVIAFGYMAQLIETTHSNAISELGTRLGTLKGIAILDSPLGGVTDNSNYENTIIRQAFTCEFNRAPRGDLTTIGGLQTLYKTASSSTHRGETARILNAFMGSKYITNQQVATDAMTLGVAVLIVGNENDLLWRPEVCGAGPDFLSTEYLQELGKQRNGGALYSRSLVSSSSTLPGPIECSSLRETGAYHSDVLHNVYVEQAIWETFTGSPLDQLTPETETLTPTVSPSPTPPLSRTPPPQTKLEVYPTTLHESICPLLEDRGYFCTVIVAEPLASQGNIDWAARSDGSGVQFIPPSGSLFPGQSMLVTIVFSSCQARTLFFVGLENRSRNQAASSSSAETCWERARTCKL